MWLLRFFTVFTGDHQLLGDVAVAPAGGQQPQHLQLPVVRGSISPGTAWVALPV
ncbi:MAG TPA: hypothetical protein VFA46_18260 [Actinomycetes bacterium]|jgi:hypothetical protein|nr:hypothetical protein [Actinomycetes bacterium]